MSKFTKLDKAKAQLLGKSPFFATLMMGTPLIENNTIPTAATDGKKIYYNAAFIDSLSVDLVQFVLGHELVHIMMEHVYRRGARDPAKFNIAGDHVGNLLLKGDGFTIWEHAYCDEKYANMTTEQVYQDLQENGAPEKAGGMGQDLLPPESGDAGQSEADISDIRQRVAQAANVARMAGKMSVGLAKLVDEVLNPKVRWQDLLRDYATRANKDDESWTRRNRRFGNVYLPARYSERMGEIIVIGDTSGSIGQEELNQVGAEVRAIAEQMRPECIRVLWADTEVAGEQIFEVGEEITFDPKGGGGTDMRVPLDYATRYDPEVVVLITDGYTPWPDVEPEYPLIVVCTTNTDVPVGQVVRMA